MSYYTIGLLAQLGVAFIALALIVRHYRPSKRGATLGNKQQVAAHQRKREAYMLRNGGLPVEMRRLADDN